MADLVEARVVADFQRIVGTYIPTPETGYGGGINGTITLTPQFPKGAAHGVYSGTTMYTIHALPCFVLWGQLHDVDLADPWQDIITSIDGTPIEWVATFNLSYKHLPHEPAQRLTLAPVRFGPANVVAGQISLTLLLA